MNWTAGDFRQGLEPLDTELADTELEVSGRLPDWLDGTLVRNGPGRWTAQAHGGGQSARHWFDGLAMLQRFTISGGRVRYANRYVQSPAFEAASQHGRYRYAEVGLADDRSWPQRLRTLGRPPQTGTNASVNVLRVGGRPVAVTETPDVIPFNPVTLETLPPVGFTDDLPSHTDCAHPHQIDRTDQRDDDPDRGGMVNFGVEYGPRSSYHLYELAEGSTTRRLLASVPARRASYMHSFGATADYVVLVEYPLLADPVALLAGRPFVDGYRWQPQHGTRFTVVQRSTGDVVTRSTAPAFFCFHQVNTFVDDGDLVIDQPAISGEQGLRQFLLSELHGPGPRSPAGELRRYRVPLDGGPVTYRLLSPTTVEFPRIAYERVAGRPHRWVFGVGTPATLTTSLTDRLVKIDAETGAATLWRQPGCWPGEPILVPSPDAGSQEDAGLVLSVVLDAVARASFLLVLDAETFTEVARAALPHRVPLGFHGQWLDGVGW